MTFQREKKNGTKPAPTPTLLTANCSIWLFFLLNSFCTSLNTPLAPSRSPEAPWHTGKRQNRWRGTLRGGKKKIPAMSTSDGLTSGQVGVVALRPTRLVLQPFKRPVRVLEVQLDHATPAWRRDKINRNVNPSPDGATLASMSLIWWGNTYQSHRDTHAGSLFGLMRALMHHGNRPKHCWYGTGDRESTHTRWQVTVVMSDTQRMHVMNDKSKADQMLVSSRTICMHGNYSALHNYWYLLNKNGSVYALIP